MSEMKSKPPTPTNVVEGKSCNVLINKQLRNKLAISHDYEDQNEKYKRGLVKRGIVLTDKELAKRLITDELIEKALIPQLNGKELRHHSVHRHWNAWKYYAFSPVYDRRDKPRWWWPRIFGNCWLLSGEGGKEINTGRYIDIKLLWKN